MTSVAETRCLDLTVKRVIVVFVIKVEDLPRRVSAAAEAARGVDGGAAGRRRPGAVVAMACGVLVVK